MTRILNVLRSIAALEPAVVRTLLGLIVTLLARWGVDLADLSEKVEGTVVDVITLAGVLVTLLVVRRAVAPASAVVARVQDPTSDNVVLLAGHAANVRTGGRVSGGDTLEQLTLRDDA